MYISGPPVGPETPAVIHRVDLIRSVRVHAMENGGKGTCLQNKYFEYKLHTKK